MSDNKNNTQKPRSKTTRINVGASRTMAAMPELLRNEGAQPTDVGRMLWVPADQIEPDEKQVRSGLRVRPEMVRAARDAALDGREDCSNEYFEALLALEPQEDVREARTPGAWEGLVNLSRSIKEHQLQQPIIVSEQGRRYPVIAGERRYLASLMAGHDKIWCVVRAGKPADLKLRIVQWTENAHRSDLSLIETVDFVREVAALHLADKGQPVERAFFEDSLSLSQAQSYRYLALAQASQDRFNALREQIKSGEVTSLQDAVSSLRASLSADKKSAPRVSARPFKVGRVQKPAALKRLIEVWRDALPTAALSDRDRDRLSSLEGAELETPQEQRAAFKVLEDLWNKVFEDKDNE